MAELKNLEFVQGTAVTAPSPGQLDVGTPDGSVASRAVNVAYLGVLGVDQVNNKTATADPAVTDDSGDGYDEGSWWVRIDTSPRRYFVCVNPALGAAVWKRVVFTNDVINFTDTTQSTSKDTGSVILEGGMGIEKNLFVGGNLEVTGDLTIQGTATTLNTTTLDVEDINITVNKGGNDASSEGAGITVDRTGTKGSIIYALAATSRFKVGPLGAEIEVVTISNSQTLTNKTIAGGSNTITGLVRSTALAAGTAYRIVANDVSGAMSENAALTAARAIVSDTNGQLAVSTTSTTELNFVTGVTSAIQTQINSKVGLSNVSVSSNVTLSNNGLHLVDTSAARSLALPNPATTGHIVIKDSTGQCRTNNITITRFGSEQIEFVAASYVMSSDGQCIHFITNGTNWFIVN